MLDYGLGYNFMINGWLLGSKRMHMTTSVIKSVVGTTDLIGSR